MGANRYWCENSFGAIKKFLWIEIGHFVAIFLHFWAFLVTLMAVATTILLTLGTGCTKRLLRHMGWWYGTIFALLSHIASAGWGQKWLIFEVKIRSQWQASSRAGNQPGNRFMCHITSQYMGQHDYGPFLQETLDRGWRWKTHCQHSLAFSGAGRIYSVNQGDWILSPWMASQSWE